MVLHIHNLAVSPTLSVDSNVAARPTKDKPPRITLDKRIHFVHSDKAPSPVYMGLRRTGKGNSRQNGERTKNHQTRGPRDYHSDRKHLTGREVERLIEATKGSRNEAGDRCLMLLTFRHGLRVSEACRLKLDQVDAEAACCMSPD